MRYQALLLCLALLASDAAARADALATLGVASYRQRMSDRYTSHDGLPAGRVSDIRVDGAAVVVRTGAGLATFADGRWQILDASRNTPFPKVAVDAEKLPAGAVVRSAAKGGDGTTWVVTDRGVFRSLGDKYVPVSKPTSYLVRQEVVNMDADLTCVAVDTAGTVWFGTTAGAYATDGKNWWNPVDRRAGLPYENVTCLTFGVNSDLWVGTTEGVCRYTAGGRWNYYWGPRWLPNNHVNAIAVAADGSAWVATDAGVAHLRDSNITLEQKAAHYQRITEERHDRYGYVTSSSFKKPGDVNGGVVYSASDNDGLWTSVYVAAEAFRYAATHDQQAREQARKSMFAMLNLVKYTGVPGFPARAIIHVGEKDVDGYDANETVRIPGETEKIWFKSPVDSSVLCKGDTSSDELDGHYFAWYVYYTLVADAAEKKVVADTVRAVTDNIVNHDLFLFGHTGRRTMWGYWNPKFLNDDPMRWEERGINALEILAYLKLAEHITGDAKYGAKYRELITRDHYLLNTVTEKVGYAWYGQNHSDDQMAFMMYYVLMMIEKDPDTRRVLLQSMQRSWEIQRPDQSPFFNFVYGATTGRPCDVETSLQVLQDWPWELINWRTENSQRVDIQFRHVNWGNESKTETATVVPASERRIIQWSGNPYETGGGSDNGGGEDDGSAWLLPYWMGRYHGFIAEKAE